MVRILALATAWVVCSTLSAVAADRILFEDGFGESSRNLLVDNPVTQPPPQGMGYTTDTPSGYVPKHWLIADAEPNGPRRSFWCLPVLSDGQSPTVLKQAGRSRNSVAFARTMIPIGAKRFTIQFRQRCQDNDYIGYVLGARQPRGDHDGFEFSYQRQLPGTDETVDDIYYDGDLGKGIIKNQAKNRRWASHRIEVDGDRVRWIQDDVLLLEGTTSKPLHGYFGFRQKYERGTQYDDFKIIVHEETRPTGPNVLFIAVDDLRNDLGCYGNDQIRSPSIDKFASEGIRFDLAYCQYPLCNPSRASVLTGLRPDSTGVNRTQLNNTFHFRSKVPHVVTLPQLFQQYGYHVGRIGKLYHYGVPREIGTESALDDRRSWQFALYPRGGEKDEEDALISYTPERSSGWALSWQISKTPALEHTDGKVATETIEKLRELKDEPFFIAAGFYRPHVPSTAPDGYFEAYPYSTIHLPNEPKEHSKLIPDAAFDADLAVDAAGEDLRWFKRAYYATVSLVDEQIGRVLAEVKRLGLEENTIVVLWSDHGWMLGEHGQWEKRVLFEEGARVPLVIRAPGQAGNGMPCSRVVELVDLYPTLAELCGLPIPDTLEGKSLVPLLSNPDAEWSDLAFSQVSRRQTIGRSVRTPRWRYTEWDHGQEGRELYDHETDPKEYHNLAVDPSPQAQQVMVALKSKLDQQFNANPSQRSTR